MDAGRLPRDEGGGRLGGGLHRVLLDQPRVRRDALRVGPAVGRRGHAGASDDDRPGARARRAGRGRAVARRRLRRGPRVAAAAAGAVADQQRPGQRGGAKDDGARRHPAGAGGVGRGCEAGARRRVRHHLRVRVAHLPAHAVPVARVQPAQRRLRRQLREPGAVLARGDRAGQGGGRRRCRDRGADRRRHAGAVRGADRGGARVHPRRRPDGRPVGRGDRLDVGAGAARLGPVAVLRPGLPDDLVGPCPRGDREADRGGGQVHRPRPDGQPGAGRHRRSDRRGAAVDLGSVPAAEDRAGPLRRDPRVHRLQRLLLAVDLGPASGLHPERHSGRGVPARVASGAVRPRRERRPRGAGGGCRAGRHGVRHGARQARHGAGAPGGRGRRHRWLHELDHAHARPRDVGPRGRLPACPDRPAGQRLAGARHPAVGGRRARLRRPDRGRGDRFALGRRRHQRRHAAADPRRRFHAAARADAGAGDGRGQAAARQPGGGCRLRGLLRRLGAGRAAAQRRATRSSS